MSLWLLASVFIGLLVLRVPIAVVAGLTSLIYIFVTQEFSPTLAPLVAIEALDRFSLLAIPFFVLAGQLMSSGGIARTLLVFVDKFFGRMYGGLALVTVLASAIFADMSGSAPATVAAIGTLTIPAMIKQGYAPAFAGAVAASSGVLALVIPPSNTMVLYGLSANVSLGRMFLAGVVPGLILTIALLVATYAVARVHGWRSDRERGTPKEIVLAAWEAKWAFLVPVIILGGIYSGICTPTESAAIACVYALVIGLFIYKEFTLRDLPRIMASAANLIVAIMFVIAMATLFGQLVTLLGLPQKVSESLLSVSSEPLVVLVIVNVLLLIVGMFMDGGAAIILLAPVLLVTARQLGLDPVYFGALMIVNLAVGCITPPLGVNLFVANSIANISSEKIFIAALPLVFALLVGLAVIVLFPGLTLGLVHYYYGS